MPFHVYPQHKVERWGLATLRYYRDQLLPDPRSGVIPARYVHLSKKETDTIPPEEV